MFSFRPCFPRVRGVFLEWWRKDRRVRKVEDENMEKGVVGSRTGVESCPLHFHTASVVRISGAVI